MLFRDNFAPAAIVVKFAVLIFSLTFHEFAHGYMAYLCGDDTARRAGRLTLNPLAHLDIMGTIMILFAPIGWAKPVPVNPSRMKHPRRDDMLVAMAGPGANIVIALLAGLALRGLTSSQGNLLYAAQGQVGLLAAAAGALSLMVFMNLALAFFNLIPLFPLDGSHVLENLLPLEIQMKYLEIRHYLPYVLLGLILFTNILGSIIFWPIIYIAPAFSGYGADALGYMIQQVTGG